MILITGASGFLGKGIKKKLQELQIPFKTLSAKQNEIDKINNFYWNYLNEIDLAAFEGVDTIINLAGENIGEGRWTKSKKQKIMDSRVNTVKLLKKSIVENNFPIKKFISASAIGFYPEIGIGIQDENTQIGLGFLPEVCKNWEEEVNELSKFGIEVCIMRIGVVLGDGGGMLAEMKLPMKFGILPILGSGKQWVSWIHEVDVVKAFVEAALNKNITGTNNLVAPNPVAMKQLMKAIAGKRKFLSIPAPSFLLKILLGEKSIIVLNDQNVSSKKLVNSGFVFTYPKISDVLF